MAMNLGRKIIRRLASAMEGNPRSSTALAGEKACPCHRSNKQSSYNGLPSSEIDCPMFPLYLSGLACACITNIPLCGYLWYDLNKKTRVLKSSHPIQDLDEKTAGRKGDCQARPGD